MKTVRITAKTVDEAVVEGLRKLGATREEAVVRVIEEPTGGLFGLLRKNFCAGPGRICRYCQRGSPRSE